MDILDRLIVEQEKAAMTAEYAASVVSEAPYGLSTKAVELQVRIMMSNQAVILRSIAALAGMVRAVRAGEVLPPAPLPEPPPAIPHPRGKRADLSVVSPPANGAERGE